MKLTIKTKLKDYSIQQWSDLMNILDGYKEKPDSEVRIEDKVAIVSIMAKVPYNTLLQEPMATIEKAFKFCVSTISSHTKSIPPKEIKIQGNTYELIDYVGGKVQGGWFVDVDCMAKDFKINPSLIPALNYVEKGKRYAETDDEGNIINSVKERAEIFKDHFPADVFVDLCVFFLEVFVEWSKITSTQKMSQIESQLEKIAKEIPYTTGSL